MKPMVLDWIYSPYCSAGWIAREAARSYGLELREWDLTKIKDAAIVLLPQNISNAVKQVRKQGLHRRIEGAEPQFFLDGQSLGSQRLWKNLSSILEERGCEKLNEPQIPECFVHPRLNADRDESVMEVIAVTDIDIAGDGLPSPACCEQCRFGTLGTEETLGFMTEITRSYGRMMSIAFVGTEVAGFITHVPKPIANKMGCAFVNDVQEPKVLQIIDLFVYPRFRHKGIATQLLKFTNEFCRKNRIERIEVFSAIRPVVSEPIATGSQHPYLSFGFEEKRIILEPSDKSGEDGLGLAHLIYTRIEQNNHHRLTT